MGYQRRVHGECCPLTQTLTMRAFITVFLAVAVSGEADPYTIGQVLTGQTAGGVITGVTYGHGLGKVAGFPYTAVHAVAPVVHGYSAGYPLVYGKREAEAEPEPYTVGQIAAGAHIASAIADGRPHNVGVITNAAIAPSTITDTLDIPTSTARGRPSPSMESSLTCTTLVLWPTLGSDTLWPSLDTDTSLTPLTPVSAPMWPVSRFLVRWRSSRRRIDENIRQK